MSEGLGTELVTSDKDHHMTATSFNLTQANC